MGLKTKVARATTLPYIMAGFGEFKGSDGKIFAWLNKISGCLYMMRQPENGKPALLLAVRAVKRAALADNGFGNRRAAVGAGLVGFAVHLVFLLEIAAFAFAVDKIA